MKDVEFTLVVEFEMKYRKLLLDIYYLFIALFIARYYANEITRGFFLYESVAAIHHRTSQLF